MYACMYLYTTHIEICMYVCVCVCMHIYIYPTAHASAWRRAGATTAREDSTHIFLGEFAWAFNAVGARSWNLLGIVNNPLYI
jgi:hypothetical protein